MRRFLTTCILLTACLVSLSALAAEPTPYPADWAQKEIARADALTDEGHVDKAIALLDSAIKDAEGTPGGTPDALADLALELGLYCAVDGRYQQAEAAYLRAVAFREVAYGTDNPMVVEALDGLAQVYAEQNKVDAAAPVFRRIADIWQRVNDPQDPSAGIALMQLADLYEGAGRKEEARAARKEASAWEELIAAGPREAPPLPQDAPPGPHAAPISDALAPGDTVKTPPAASPPPIEADAGQAPAAVDAAPAAKTAIEPADWDPDLIKRMNSLSLSYIDRINAALSMIVRNFGHSFSKEDLAKIYGERKASEAEELFDMLYGYLEKGGPGAESFYNFLAMVKAAKDPWKYENWDRFVKGAVGEDVVEQYTETEEYIKDVRSHIHRNLALVGLHKDSKLSKVLEQANKLAGHKEKLEQLFEDNKKEIDFVLKGLGIDLEQELKLKKDFLISMAGISPDDVSKLQGHYQTLQQNLAEISNNHRQIESVLRLLGVDMDAALKKRARSGSALAQAPQTAAPRRTLQSEEYGVFEDPANQALTVEPYLDKLVIHYNKTDGSYIPDVAAMISHWEHGKFPEVTRFQMAWLVGLAKERFPAESPVRDFLVRTHADLGLHYLQEASANSDRDVRWRSPRVSRWEKSDDSPAARESLNTLYDLDLHTDGRFQVPYEGPYLEKTLQSAVGMAVAVRLDYTKLSPAARALLNKKQPATLHLAIQADRGLEIEVFDDPEHLDRDLDRKPYATARTPESTPPAFGWEIPLPKPEAAQNKPFHVLVDVRPVPGVAANTPKTFKLHACLLVPVDISGIGNGRSGKGGFAKRVAFPIPLWHYTGQIPDTARILVYRKPAAGDAKTPWTQLFKDQNGLAIAGGRWGPDNGGSSLKAVSGKLGLNFVLEDATARQGTEYEYCVLHRCSIKLHPDKFSCGGAGCAFNEILRAVAEDLKLDPKCINYSPQVRWGSYSTNICARGSYPETSIVLKGFDSQEEALAAAEKDSRKWGGYKPTPVEVPGGGKAWINQLKSLQGTRGWLVMNGVFAKITHHREEWFEDRWSEYDNEVAPLEWEYIPTLVKATARRLQECKD